MWLEEHSRIEETGKPRSGDKETQEGPFRRQRTNTLARVVAVLKNL